MKEKKLIEPLIRKIINVVVNTYGEGKIYTLYSLVYRFQMFGSVDKMVEKSVPTNKNKLFLTAVCRSEKFAI